MFTLPTISPNHASWPSTARFGLTTALFLVLGPSGCASSGSPAPDTGTSRDVTVRVHNAVGRSEIELQTDAQEATNFVLAPQSSVWASLPAAFEQLGIEVGYSDPTSFTMGNPGVEVRRVDGKRLSSWIDCGYGSTAQANADTYTVLLSVMVTLVDQAQTSTEVSTRLEATAKPRSHSGHAVVCTSKRTLEPRIAELLQQLARS